MKIELEITELEINTLFSAIDEHEENLGTMDDEDYIKERKKEIKVLKKLIVKIKKQYNIGRK